MHKKLKKYIESYELIQNCKTQTLIPNAGMIVLINQETNCEIIIENISYKIESFQAVLINAYENPVYIQSDELINLVAIRFKGAGASFFYEEYMDELMHNPKEPIFMEKDIKEIELDNYFQKRFKASKLPFNIMKIIDLLDEQGSSYNIDEVLAIANVPRKILDKLFRLKTGLSFKTYAILKEQYIKN
ncbi:hypothetical protein [Poseidonibacter sp.]|uniref:hypothetical protein n=1 Tax=Poseidonibacter sp. TaxID=2321188 RepID=UPI003C709493